MNHRTILALAAVILSSAVFVFSLNSANALPQGANVSFGANPIDSAYLSSCNNTVLFTNNTQNDFIITDIINDYSGWVELRKNDGGVYTKIFKIQGNGEASLTSGITIAPGVVVDCSHYSGRGVFISGFYAHR